MDPSVSGTLAQGTVMQQQPAFSGPNTFPITAVDPVFLNLFGRVEHSFSRRVISLHISGQNRLCVQMYNYLCEKVPDELPITRLEFVRMWRSIMLKRVQDNHYKYTGILSDYYMTLPSGILVPGPLRDILCALGRYVSSMTGLVIDVVPPVHQQAGFVPNWYEVDDDLVRKWILTMNAIAPRYNVYKAPDVDQSTGTAIVLTSIKDEWGSRQVRGLTSEYTAVDVCLRVVNDDLFREPIAPFEEMAIDSPEQYFTRTERDVYMKVYDEPSVR